MAGWETPPVTIARRAPSSGTSPADDRDHPRRAEATIVEPRGGGVAARAAERSCGLRPVWTFTAVALAGYALLAAAIVLLGLLLTKLLLPIDPIAEADRWLPDWLADQRRPWFDDASFVGSMIGDVPVLPALLLAALIGAAVVRRIRIGVFIMTAAVMEVGLYWLAAPGPRASAWTSCVWMTCRSTRAFPPDTWPPPSWSTSGSRSSSRQRVRQAAATVPAWTVAIAMVLGGLRLADVIPGYASSLRQPSACAAGPGLLVALVAVRAFGYAQRLHRNRATRPVLQE